MQLAQKNKPADNNSRLSIMTHLPISVEYILLSLSYVIPCFLSPVVALLGLTSNKEVKEDQIVTGVW